MLIRWSGPGCNSQHLHQSQKTHNIGVCFLGVSEDRHTLKPYWRLIVGELKRILTGNNTFALAA